MSNQERDGDEGSNQQYFGGDTAGVSPAPSSGFGGVPNNHELDATADSAPATASIQSRSIVATPRMIVILKAFGVNFWKVPPVMQMLLAYQTCLP